MAGNGHAQSALLGLPRCNSADVVAHKNKIGSGAVAGIEPAQTALFGIYQYNLAFFNAKRRREIKSTLPFSASHEALRRMAVFPVQLTRSHTRPASREACCRAAALGTKASETRGPLPSVSRAPCLSLRPCAPTARSPGSRGTAPCQPLTRRRVRARLSLASAMRNCSSLRSRARRRSSASCRAR